MTRAQIPSKNLYININIQGALHIIITLDVHKTYGTDHIPPRVLKETAYTIAPV